MELTLSRETLCFERLALLQREQVSVEGEATLPGSMRDAVTVLSVQAQAYLEKAEAVAGGVMFKGHVSFQALYTQGDLTRIRAMETTCDFEHSIEAQEATPDMRVNASVAVQETEGTAVSGRMTLRALLDIQAEAFETTRQELVTDAAQLRAVTEYTLGIFGTLEKRLLHPLVRPWLSRLVPGVYRYVPVFKRLRREYAEGRDRVLRGATAVLFIHVPRESRFGAEDGNLAYENASLMAEALGVSQIYMGFVLTAVRQDRKAKLAAMLGLGDRRICAVMALGMPQFRYPNYIDRAPAPVTRK